MLDNPEIVSIASDMGIIIPDSDFDKIDFMKDLELARHNLDNKSKKVISQEIVDEVIEPYENNNIPLFDWVNEDSEEENFILVQSKKKKREQNKLKN